MARPTKGKVIGRLPGCCRFYPETGRELTLNMSVEEYETIRLIDYLGLTQEECAREMAVARSSVQLLYQDARRKLARFLVDGLALSIQGGNYTLKSSPDGPDDAKANLSSRKGDPIMKIAVTYENGEVFQHFGHTEQFKIYTVENQEILSSEIIGTAGSGHGALAGFLKEQGAEVLICGGIGMGARNALAEAGIRLYPGASGDADEQVKAFLAGSLSYDPDTQCSHHHGEGHSCHDHDSHTCGHHCH